MSVPLRCAVALLLINLVIVAPLFTVEYTVHMGSIEAAFIAISHQWMEHGVDFGWWNIWYGGIPGPNTYPPLLHVVVAWTGNLFGISAALAHHVVCAAAYALGPLAVFWLALALSGSWISAFAGGLLYSVISPSAWLIKGVRSDIGSVWHARRLFNLILYGEGPHSLSLLLIPIAALALFLAFQRGLVSKRDRWLFPAAAFALASVVLSNWLGGFGVAAAALCLLFQRSWRDWIVAGGIGVFAYIVASPWIPPTTIKAIRTNAQWIGGDFRFGATNAVLLVALVVLAANVSVLLRRFGALVQFSASYFVLMGGITLLSEWFAVNILPQPHRYHVEMEIALCMLAGALLPKHRWAVVALALLCVYPAFRYYTHARSMIRPIEIRQTSEYKVAQWFAKNTPDRRVYTAGATSYWLNNFTDVPQLGGGFDQGITNNILPGSQFQIFSGMGAGDKEGEVAAAWLKALGVHALAVAGPGSTEPYKPISNPKKFNGVLEELWRDGGDVIYRVPQRSLSMARVIPKSAIPPAPVKSLNHVDFLDPYLAATSDPNMPEISWNWIDRNHAVAEGMLAPGQVVSVQISHHPGWRAKANGNSVAVNPDGIGFMTLEPNCNGPCKIELSYDREIPPWVAVAAILAGAGFALNGWRRA